MTYIFIPEKTFKSNYRSKNMAWWNLLICLFKLEFLEPTTLMGKTYVLAGALLISGGTFTGSITSKIRYWFFLEVDKKRQAGKTDLLVFIDDKFKIIFDLSMEDNHIQTIWADQYS